MAKWKPSVVYLRAPGFLNSLRTVRVRLRADPARGPHADGARGFVGPVRFMWDYAAYPVWGGSTLSAELEARLQAWSDEGTERFMAQLSGAAPPDGWIGEWSDRGRALAHEVAAVVGAVEYHNQATDQIEQIEGAW